jgi:alginate O-acetyltransferase complex protein AlgI
MLFNSLVFLFAFLPVAYVVFWLLPSSKLRYVWLTITGYVFYGYWDPRFCILMGFSTLVSYAAGRVILSRREKGLSIGAALVVPVTVDLLLLGFFKYAGFAARSLNELLGAAGLPGKVPILDVVLPVGISFYTFHTISYIVDSYRGVIKPTKNFFEFSAYVSLFSQLVAGPIVRFRQIESDLERLGAAERTRWLGIGASFFVFGLAEKVLIADSLSHYANPVFASPIGLSAVQAWVGVLAYTFQLYFDFSGYSTMAVGLGYMFGLRIPQNFNSPYKSLDPSDFWQRWHISLSSCLRDYVYIPFGGNRGGDLARYRNLMLTMLIGGLWHGANWTFVIWGGYHGMLLVAYHLNRNHWDRIRPLFRQLLMFLLVLMGWVVFRANSMHEAMAIYGGMFSFGAGEGQRPESAAIVLIAFAACWAMIGPNVYDFHRDFQWKEWKLVPLSAVAAACIAVIIGGRDSPFLYFQF